MGDFVTSLDLIVFVITLVAAMAVGLIAGRKEETSEDFFLAGRSIPWWGVAGSIFGSNVSANHIVGMMGIGFTVGFANSHFEIGAIAGLMLLCYGFLPVYRRLRIYTLSEYLGRRYDEPTRIGYAVIMVIIMAVVQMVPALYIGARSICVLIGGDAVELVEADDPGAPLKHIVNMNYYVGFVVALAVISASYTIFGGLKAVIWTDFIQSVLILAAGIAVSILAFRALGSWGEMMRLDRLAEGDQGAANKMGLYLPMNHPKLPWTGMLTGLMAMHFFYWGTNQFIVQRALGARSDRDARTGIVAAGFLKLLIPFFSIATGVAAFYLFRREIPDKSIPSDTVFVELVKLVIPVGYGLVGLIAAGVIGAILSSIDSMMNSSATIVTIDVYKRYINREATDREMIFMGRLSIVGFVIAATLMAIFVLNPNSDKNFFLQIADYQNYFTPGLLVAFAFGIFWKRGTPKAGFVTLLAGVVFSFIVERIYNGVHIDNRLILLDIPGLGSHEPIAELFGTQLNFFHRVVIVLVLSAIVYVVVSLNTAADPDKSRLTWAELGGHDRDESRQLAWKIVSSILFFAVLAALMVNGVLAPFQAGIIAAAWTLGMFVGRVVQARSALASKNDEPLIPVWQEDRLWAGVLCALAVYMMYHFYIKIGA